ncbi:gamma-glutamylcyclotransferase (GGCT)/AIG2-like uncharacterized protein YtfP [Evansella vedderi]|uniref:Gamma-glutamylcyclotransferase (GGCT)/AIG2-like uncharacterized protein YtfP n=1 Tax=Evansella vedderi TaxID=38282 RepID=A0ABT9ZUJ6_9BACI|nr:hypothetical protein [Evansella vedderi]MDQ0254916.1 gamma-glutamylcyclotransferase (GGCT)/AIG2-like uncharacterized protein YtfP [Evansella vedderi]
MKLSEKQLQIITETVAKVLAEQKQKEEEDKKDKRYLNTVLLLKNYRGLVVHCENVKGELWEIDNKSIQDLDLEEITLESIESIKKSRKKTVAMVMFIQSKVEAYKSMCTEDELIRYRVLEKKYISPLKMSNRQIAESENIEKTAFYKYLKQATEDIQVLFFGVDAISFK